MTPFAPIEAAALDRHGPDEIARRLPTVRSFEELRAVPDDRYLSAMSKRIFAAGFRWKVVEIKWPDIEEAFDGFDPATVASYDVAREAELREDRRIIRHPKKIHAIVENAVIVGRLAREHGGVGAWLTQWPVTDTVGLWEALSKELHMLGGASGARFLRIVKRDTFVLTPDVLTALARYEVYEGKGTGKRDRRLIQDAFNAWMDETGKPQSHLSMMLAASVP